MRHVGVPVGGGDGVLHRLLRGGPEAASLACAPPWGAVVLWAAAAWRWGIPTSESHALVAGVSGAAAALEGNLSCIRWQKWGLVLLGAGAVHRPGVLGGALGGGGHPGLGVVGRAYRVLQIPGAAGDRLSPRGPGRAEVFGGVSPGAALAQGRQGEGMARAPLWLMVLCAAFMALGTGVGGRRIIDTVGRDMVSLGPREGVLRRPGGDRLPAAGHRAGSARVHHPHPHRRPAGGGSAGGRRADWGVARSIALAWLCTFPGCMGLGWLLAKGMLEI